MRTILLAIVLLQLTLGQAFAITITPGADGTQGTAGPAQLDQSNNELFYSQGQATCLAFPGNATCTNVKGGDTVIVGPGDLVQAFSLSTPTVVGNSVTFATVTNPNLAAALTIDYATHSVGFSQSKQYRISTWWSATAGAWQLMSPSTSSGPYSGQDASVDVYILGSNLYLRLRRVSGTSPATSFVTVTAGGDPANTTVAASTSLCTVASPCTDVPTTVFAGSPAVSAFSSTSTLAKIAVSSGLVTSTATATASDLGALATNTVTATGAMRVDVVSGAVTAVRTATASDLGALATNTVTSTLAMQKVAVSSGAITATATATASDMGAIAGTGTATGTTNTLPRKTSGGYGDSAVSDDGTNVYVTGETFRIVASGFPKLLWNASGNGADQKRWQAYVENTAGKLQITTLNDLENAANAVLTLNRDSSVDIAGNATANGSRLCQANGGGCPTAATIGAMAAPSLTSGYLTKATGTATIGNSLAFDDGTHVGVGIASSLIGRLHIDLSNTDYTNTGGANSHLLLSNPSATGQTVVESLINGTPVAKWRTDYAGNINWIGYAGGHYFYTGGDFGVGGTRLSITGSAVSVLGIPLKLTGSSSGTATFQVPAAAGTTTWTWPAANCSSGQALNFSDASGTFACYTPSGGLSGLTTGYIPKATSATTLANGSLFDDGTHVGLGITSSLVGKLHLYLSNTDYTNTGGANSIALLENPSATGQTVVGFKTNGSLVGKLRSDYAGNLSYVAFSSGGHYFYVGGDSGVGSVVATINANGLQLSTASYPKVYWYATGNGTNLKYWQSYNATDGTFHLGALNDAQTAESGGLAVDRSGNTSATGTISGANLTAAGHASADCNTSNTGNCPSAVTMGGMVASSVWSGYARGPSASSIASTVGDWQTAATYSFTAPSTGANSNVVVDGTMGILAGGPGAVCFVGLFLDGTSIGNIGCDGTSNTIQGGTVTFPVNCRFIVSSGSAHNIYLQVANNGSSAYSCSVSQWQAHITAVGTPAAAPSN